MATASTNPLARSLDTALGAITSTRAAVKQAAAATYNPPPVEDHAPSGAPAPGVVAKP